LVHELNNQIRDVTAGNFLCRDFPVEKFRILDTSGTGGRPVDREADVAVEDGGRGVESGKQLRPPGVDFMTPFRPKFRD
jgi:hypothetical protein